MLEELALDAELNILQAFDRAVGRGKQVKPVSGVDDITVTDSETGLRYLFIYFLFINYRHSTQYKKR